MARVCHGINLPIANARFFGNDSGTLINTDTISDPTSLIFRAIFLFTFLVALPQMCVQSAAMTHASPNTCSGLQSSRIPASKTTTNKNSHEQ
jgi:hypothetical protein